ncbi:MAG: hypothetical protein CVV64_01075 [Candidatus Wallbacteria bacterium HGW-Wallbacteria-1]|jgi:protein-L-isoaspartate O-methyltransferase|uniref:Methyltransferase domain-containing protein n=1 Tax=Candidatus Wallbacteria bacterium HGW-Wallbacteria-1 TaxID=2013854 RepID=A0A2N1PUP8_9BACT|nr:MAG: hypothetical protein CVV64_01075 [Candidatus Wallbacteria bacterium HGW-Wallbacteria-1]
MGLKLQDSGQIGYKELFRCRPTREETLPGEISYFEFPLSENLDPGERDFRLRVQPSMHSHEDERGFQAQAINRARTFLAPLVTRVGCHGRVLEAFAGTCWMGSLLSRKAGVSEVFCMDVSSYLLTRVAPAVMLELGAVPGIMKMVRGDVNDPPFIDGSFDRIFIDAGLHHVPDQNLTEVLAGLSALLKPEGIMAAIREPFLPEAPFFRKRALENFGDSEKSLGACERIRSRDEWRSAFVAAGLVCSFIPVISGRDDQRLSLSLPLRWAARGTCLEPVLQSCWPEYMMIIRHRG